MENRSNHARTSSRKNSASAKRSYKNEKKIIKKKKKGKRAFVVILLFLFIGAIISGIYLLLTLPTFNVKEVELVGTERYAKEEVMTKLDINMDKNIFIQFFSYEKDKIEEFSFLDDVKVTMKLPNKIQIKTSERIPMYLAYDKEKNKFFKIDKDGYILEEGKIEEKTKEQMLLYGVTFADEVVFGEKINEIDYSKIVTYLSIKKEYDKSKIDKEVTKVSFENSLTTLTLDDKLIVKFPNEIDLKYKMNFLKGIIEKLPSESVGVIDMTKSKPIFSSF
ncbi:MAG: FtsQ-type POTRA domain-containing protein [Clostridia bacterium]|nr:FtsQ-type POTRA domain-containing protein [Clostridia bacterium]